MFSRSVRFYLHPLNYGDRDPMKTYFHDRSWLQRQVLDKCFFQSHLCDCVTLVSLFASSKRWMRFFPDEPTSRNQWCWASMIDYWSFRRNVDHWVILWVSNCNSEKSMKSIEVRCLRLSVRTDFVRREGRRWIWKNIISGKVLKDKCDLLWCHFLIRNRTSKRWEFPAANCFTQSLMVYAEFPPKNG